MLDQPVVQLVEVGIETIRSHNHKIAFITNVRWKYCLSMLLSKLIEWVPVIFAPPISRIAMIKTISCLVEVHLSLRMNNSREISRLRPSKRPFMTYSTCLNDLEQLSKTMKHSYRESIIMQKRLSMKSMQRRSNYARSTKTHPAIVSWCSKFSSSFLSLSPFTSCSFSELIIKGQNSKRKIFYQKLTIILL